MRARHRYFLGTLLAAVVVALTSQLAPAPGLVASASCPASTTWDDLLHRCV
jgi:hypothetical protein